MPPKRKTPTSEADSSTHLVCTEGGSSKFWNISIAGSSTTVNFGKIGTNGTTQVKAHASDEAAAKFASKEIASKIKKGYTPADSATANSPDSSIKKVSKKSKTATIPSAAVGKKTSTKKSDVAIQLWDALEKRNLEAAKVCLEAGANPDIIQVPRDLKGKLYNVFDVVCISSMTDEEFSGHHYGQGNDDGKMPEEQDAWVTALMKAAGRADLDAIRLLCSFNASLNFAQPSLTYADGYNYGGITALMCARKSVEATRLLCELGANVNAMMHGTPGYEQGSHPTHLNFSPLLLADSEEICRILVQYSADVNHASILNEGDNFDGDVFCYWLNVSDVDWATTLLEKHGADPNWPQGRKFHRWRNEPIFTKLMKECAAGNLDMVKLLLKHGADPNMPALTSEGDDDCLTPLKVAANPEITNLLLEKGAKKVN